jgi:Xaa-Pro aminopeptidase
VKPDSTELSEKLSQLRSAIAEAGLGGVRLRGTDWFSWATCGGSNVVLLTTDTGIAEVWITERGAWVLTDVIEAERLSREEVPAGLEVWSAPWADREARQRWVAQTAGSGPIASDRPEAGEVPLPPALWAARSALKAEELARYRLLGRDTATAMTEVLTAARPEWTGQQLAGAAAEVLWSRGLHPALTLVGDERRLPLYRHPTASHERLGARAMLVCCARRHGLFANVTRFVSFRAPTEAERRSMESVAEVEAAAFAASRPGATLGAVFHAMCEAYARAGHAGEELKHHQGGSCGYLSRDVIARPGDPTVLQPMNAVAWNPSVPGAKVEDTVVISAGGIEVLTVDPAWPTVDRGGHSRPDVLVR